MSSSDLGSVRLDNIKDATFDMNVNVKGPPCNISEGSIGMKWDKKHMYVISCAYIY